MCDECKDLGGGAGEACQACCEHEYDPDEGFMCLNCGKDGTEHVLSRAYDRVKDAIKYGE